MQPSPAFLIVSVLLPFANGTRTVKVCDAVVIEPEATLATSTPFNSTVSVEFSVYFGLPP